jgi:hypothetical protein
MVTFLGIETSPVTPTLAVQLGLPKGFGLIVSAVLPDSPAAAALRPHDVLIRFEDQQLVDARQLGALVRARNEGDQVTLTYCRAGKMGSGQVRLGKREIPVAWREFDVEPGEPGDFPPSLPGAGRARADRLLSLVEGDGDDLRTSEMRVVRRFEGGLPHSTAVAMGDGQMKFRDEQGTIEIMVKDGRKTVTATDPKGATQYSGPLDSPEDEKAIPEPIRSRIQKLTTPKNFRFRTDGDFEGEVRAVSGHPLSLALPSLPGSDDADSL